MEHIVFEIAERQLSTLKDFQRILKEERDSIIAFSIEGILRSNNKKEELLKKLEFLESEKKRLINDAQDRDEILNDEKWKRISNEIRSTLNDINVSLGKNINLLSFSMDYVKNTIENVVDFVNKTSYPKGTGTTRLSAFPVREI